ncbi:hypothetical protein [Flavobacterium sp. UBA7682]|uniref:hypothetical protein n=1 Tax=Flavobacterium sp. UBA7682 TaxID=1946560 RepID=UPI0025BA8DFC|nr:hypothetical protein [Flavobacterium sp. UBA7682]
MNELGKLLETRLKIPVDSGIDFGTFAEVIYNNRNIGTVQLVHTPGNLIIDTSPSSTNKLKWDYIYDSNRGEINALVAAIFSVAVENISITLGDFKRLYVKDLNGHLIGSVSCNYEEGQWHVIQENAK